MALIILKLGLSSENPCLSMESSDCEIELHEQVDENFLRIFLEVGRGCSKEMLYLETGTIPIRFTIFELVERKW